ncbi:lysostaphin resistance A-like protein [Jannaschia sp. 2305UL9-9]|uniref:CPBP family intramembrane glutamic endopeptidase n=1 Tax=Jannaschia sp. 2305UL9-9 TaxID=3121638 RepID=UPI0035299204
MWTPEFQSFVAPARAKPQVWRLLLGIVTVLGVYMLGIIAILLAVWALAGNAGLTGWMQRIALADTPTAVLLMLATFTGMAAGCGLAVRAWHGRAASTLSGAGTARGFAVAGIIAAVVFIMTMVILPAPFTLIRNTPADLFLSFLPLAILGLLVQTGAEEVLFRGYLQQQVAARFDHPFVWMVLPACLFGMLHLDPATAGPNAWLLVAAATLFGLVAADLTRVTGSIGAAWGMHFVNNAFAVLIVALDGSLSGLSWWKTPFTATNTDILRPLIAQDLITTIIIWAAIRLWLARRTGRAAAN